MIPSGARKVLSLELKSDRDVALTRRRVGDFMTQQGSSDLMRTRFVTAVSEVARNAVTHGGGGTIALYSLPGRGVLVECSDKGEGIADIDAAMADGFTTRGGMGRGLGGAKRLSVDFEIESVPGAGTTVRMTGLLRNRS